MTAQTQLRSYSEQQRAFGNSNICNWSQLYIDHHLIGGNCEDFFDPRIKVISFMCVLRCSTTIGLRNICPLHCTILLSSWRKTVIGLRNICPLHCTILLSSWRKIVYLMLCARSSPSGWPCAACSLPKSVGGPQTAASSDAGARVTLITPTAPAVFPLCSVSHTLFFINSRCKQDHLLSDDHCIPTVVTLQIKSMMPTHWCQVQIQNSK